MSAKRTADRCQCWALAGGWQFIKPIEHGYDPSFVDQPGGHARAPPVWGRCDAAEWVELGCQLRGDPPADVLPGRVPGTDGQQHRHRILGAPAVQQVENQAHRQGRLARSWLAENDEPTRRAYPGEDTADI